jgi:transcriptional regulator with XRE-family HTH domain
MPRDAINGKVEPGEVTGMIPGARESGPSGRRQEHLEFREIYRRIIDESTRAYDLGPDFADALERRLLEAPAAACSEAIGRWLLRRLRDAGWTQAELAVRIGVDRSAVTRWIRGGAITIKHLSLILLELGDRLADLPVPVREELAVEAYGAAITYTRAELARRRGGPSDGIREPRPLDREQFWCLYHLLAEPHWEQAVRRKDRRLLEQEAERVLRRAAEDLGHRPRAILGYRDLMDLVSEWMEAWVLCLAHITPRSWPIR